MDPRLQNCNHGKNGLEYSYVVDRKGEEAFWVWFLRLMTDWHATHEKSKVLYEIEEDTGPLAKLR